MQVPNPEISEHVKLFENDGRVILALHGEVDILFTMQAGPFLDRITAQRDLRLVIDLTPTEFIDCSGLALLCRAQRRVTERGGTYATVCPRPFTRRLIRAASLLARLHVMPTLERALASKD
ncbi:STAS domain-containing protein [Streptomyces sp. NPDC050085]